MTFTLEEVKDYLRVDSDDEDTQITSMMEAAKRFIVEAVGSFDEEDALVVMLAKAVVQNMYDHRELTQSDQQQKKGIETMFRSIIRQLQAKQFMEGASS